MHLDLGRSQTAYTPFYVYRKQEKTFAHYCLSAAFDVHLEFGLMGRCLSFARHIRRTSWQARASLAPSGERGRIDQDQGDDVYGMMPCFLS